MATKECIDYCCYKPQCKCCVEYSVRDLNHLIYAAESKLADYMDSERSRLNDGFGKIEDEAKKFSRLSSYVFVLKDAHKRALKGAVACLLCEDLQAVIESIKFLIDEPCGLEYRKDIAIEQFLISTLQNPECVSLEVWEQAITTVCNNINYNLRIVDDQDLQEIVYVLSTKIEDCTINYDLDVDIQNCEIEYQKLVREYDCKITFEEYVNLIKCDLTFNQIASFYECGIEFSYNINDCCPEVTLNGETVSLCDLSATATTT